jgi:CRP/FNR family transcriptional regulator
LEIETQLMSIDVKMAPLPYCGTRVLCDECTVRGLAVCGSLSDTELPDLAAMASTKRLEPGQTLFHEGDTAQDVYTLTHGILKLYKLMGDGRRQITGFLLPGDFLGLAYSQVYVYSAEAVAQTTVCRFPRRQFMRLLDRYPALEKDLLGRASSELAAAQDQMLLLGRKTARERLATFLEKVAMRHDARPGQAVPLPMSRTDIADYLGLTIETVSRTFSALKAERLIALPDKSHFVIVASDGLNEAAGE